MIAATVPSRAGSSSGFRRRGAMVGHIQDLDAGKIGADGFAAALIASADPIETGRMIRCCAASGACRGLPLSSGATTAVAIGSGSRAASVNAKCLCR